MKILQGNVLQQNLIDAAKYFGSLNYIDEKRIGIQGWSYGGYMSSLAITKGALQNKSLHLN